jgi:hypothetical protein
MLFERHKKLIAHLVQMFPCQSFPLDPFTSQIAGSQADQFRHKMLLAIVNLRKWDGGKQLFLSSPFGVYLIQLVPFCPKFIGMFN